MSVFSERLRLLRGKESQSEFSKRLGISQVTYGRYELGKREPDLSTLIRIGLTLGVSLDWLLGVSDIDEKKDHDNKRKLESLKRAIIDIVKEY